jgi:hypothetical protein
MKIVMLTRKNNKNMTEIFSSRILNRSSLIDKMKLKKDTRYPNQYHHPGNVMAKALGISNNCASDDVSSIFQHLVEISFNFIFSI